MNAIVIVIVIVIAIDSLRRDHLGCCGNPSIKTPHLDALAASSAIFERAYIAFHATLPARVDLLTGRYTFCLDGRYYWAQDLI